MPEKRVRIKGVKVTLVGRSKRELENNTREAVKYEARIYNKSVRTMLENGEPNKTIWSDSWADAHYESVVAASPEHAISLVYNKFPERAGFVITDLVEMDGRSN